MRTQNVQNTLIRLWSNRLAELAKAVDVGDLSAEQEAKEWQSIEDCLAVKAANPDSTMGDTWSLVVLGFKSPSWILGIQVGAA